jgi:predicted double-glycine peptidase
VLFKRIKRICQIQSGCKVAFREGLPETFPVYISVDGENYVLRTPEMLSIDTNRVAR